MKYVLQLPLSYSVLQTQHRRFQSKRRSKRLFGRMFSLMSGVSENLVIARTRTLREAPALRRILGRGSGLSPERVAGLDRKWIEADVVGWNGEV